MSRSEKVVKNKLNNDFDRSRGPARDGVIGVVAYYDELVECLYMILISSRFVFQPHASLPVATVRCISRRG